VLRTSPRASEQKRKCGTVSPQPHFFEEAAGVQKSVAKTNSKKLVKFAKEMIVAGKILRGLVLSLCFPFEPPRLKKTLKTFSPAMREGEGPPTLNRRKVVKWIPTIRNQIAAALDALLCSLRSMILNLSP